MRRRDEGTPRNRTMVVLVSFSDVVFSSAYVADVLRPKNPVSNLVSCSVVAVPLIALLRCGCPTYRHDQTPPLPPSMAPKPSCLLAPASDGVQNTGTTNTKASSTIQRPMQNHSSLQNFAGPGKVKRKRKRLSAPRTRDTLSTWSHHILSSQSDGFSSHSPLLKQAYWLVDSKLILPKKNDEQEGVAKSGEVEKENLGDSELEINNNEQHPIPRRCTHCLSQRTAQWRAGPLGPKTPMQCMWGEVQA
ncbi:hypothetical protein SESBI_14358 [Sesbania bispinosa]|nr:hypothetical protein SESBI_14358 [Sesbania bispinosa]